MPQLRSSHFASLLAVGLIACSSTKKPATVDAPQVLPDTPGSSCTSSTFGAQDIVSPGDGTFAIWGGDITPDLGGGGPSQYRIEFYSGIETSLTAPLDLSMGKQSNYMTCAACVRVISRDATGAIAKQWFQDGGTMTLSQDPFTATHMAGTITNLSLVEVTVDPQTFATTPVTGGTCLSLGTVALEHDAIPNAWTCAKAAYKDGANCNCACGTHDPDCDTAANPVAGCTGTQVCANNDTCTNTCSVNTPTVTCATGTCGYETATQDICYTNPAVVDPAALGAACASTTPLLCAVAGSIATGVCDNFVGHDQICRKACDQNADCGSGNVCDSLFASPATKGLCVTPPANDTCQTATTITIGTPVNGDSTFAASNYNAGLEASTCDGFSQSGPDVAYKVALLLNQAITVTVTTADANFDPSVAIAGPGVAATVCDMASIACLKGSDTMLAGQPETFTYTATTPGLYFIIVDSFGFPGGPFTLTVTSP